MKSWLYSVLFGMVLTVGCAVGPQPRLEAYLGAPGALDALTGEPVDFPSLTRFPDQHLPVGLLVIQDLSGPDHALALSAESLTFLTNRLVQELQQNLPMKVVKILPADRIQPEGTRDPFIELARQHDVRYLLLAVWSSVEVEAPAMLPLQGTLSGSGARGQALGFQARNHALVELALLDTELELVLGRTNGRDWATLDRLNVPLKSNVYPVVRRSQRFAPIYPEEASAKDVLRTVAGEEALKQAVMHLQEDWRLGVPAEATSP